MTVHDTNFHGCQAPEVHGVFSAVFACFCAVPAWVVAFVEEGRLLLCVNLQLLYSMTAGQRNVATLDTR